MPASPFSSLTGTYLTATHPATARQRLSIGDVAGSARLARRLPKFTRRSGNSPAGAGTMFRVTGQVGRAGGWWLALVIVCAVGLVIGGVLLASRPGPDPAAGPAAGSSPAATGRAGTSIATPGGSLSPSPVRAGLIASAPPAPAPAPSAQPAPSPQPAPSASSAASSPPPYLTMDPASGAATLTPTWSASACPSGYQGSAVLFELNTDGTIASSISATVYSVTAPFSSTLDGPVGRLITLGSDVQAGGTSTWVVGCFAAVAGTGARKLVQSIAVHLSADGSSYTTSAS